MPLTTLKICLFGRNDDDSRIAPVTVQRTASCMTTQPFTLKEMSVYLSLLLTVIYSFFCSCSGRPSAERFLVEGDSQMESRPYSAILRKYVFFHLSGI